MRIMRRSTYLLWRTIRRRQNTVPEHIGCPGPMHLVHLVNLLNHFFVTKFVTKWRTFLFQSDEMTRRIKGLVKLEIDIISDIEKLLK